MKFVSIVVAGQNRVGILTQSDACVVLDPAAGWPTDLLPIITSPEHLDRAREQKNVAPISASQWKWRPPISGVEKLICIGKNYADHAREMGGEPPEIPVVFNKFASTITAPEADVELPTLSDQVDFEAELVVVIGTPGRNIARENAMDHVFGYCCGNDISARDWQKGKPGGQWLLGKTFDTFAPLGPALVTKDEIEDPHQLDIQLRLNGAVMQDSNTREFIFPIDMLIAHLSQFVTLEPGDLIFTGTPPGVGAGRKPPVFLKPGDRLEVEIQHLGVLKNNVVAGS